MSILKGIKDVGLDVFISYHPVVTKLKRESKDLHKELKIQGFSLMQCQELIAKRHGFNNWHHFFQLIKKHYQVGLERIPFLVTTKIEKNNHFLIGYDINFGHYKWQDEDSMRTHQCIIGKDIFKDYDLFLAQQAIEKGNEVVFLNGLNDQNTLNSLKYYANTYARRDNLKIIDSESVQKFYNHFPMTSSSLAQLIFNCLDINDTENKDPFINKIASFLDILSMALVHRRDTDKTVLSLEVIKEHLNLHKFLELYTSDLPEHISVAMGKYLNSLPDFNIDNLLNPSNIEFQLNLTKKANDALDEILSLNILSNDVDAINLNIFLDRDKSIYIFNAEKKIHQKFLTTLIKLTFAKRLGVPLNDDRYTHRPQKRANLCNIFIRESHTTRGIGMVAAQARSLGISMSYSYSGLAKMQEILGAECESILINVNTKIIGAQENDAIDYFDLYKKEVTLTDIDWSKHIKDEKIKTNYSWIMKRDDVSQITFKKDYRYLNE